MSRKSNALHEAPHAVDDALALHLARSLNSSAVQSRARQTAPSQPLECNALLARHPPQADAVGIEGDDRLERNADVAGARVRVFQCGAERTGQKLAASAVAARDLAVDDARWPRSALYGKGAVRAIRSGGRAVSR